MEQTLREYLNKKDDLERSMGKILMVDMSLIPDDITVEQFMRCVNLILDSITIPKYH